MKESKDNKDIGKYEGELKRFETGIDIDVMFD